MKLNYIARPSQGFGPKVLFDQASPGDLEAALGKVEKVARELLRTEGLEDDYVGFHDNSIIIESGNTDIGYITVMAVPDPTNSSRGYIQALPTASGPSFDDFARKLFLGYVNQDGPKSPHQELVNRV